MNAFLYQTNPGKELFSEAKDLKFERGILYMIKILLSKTVHTIRIRMLWELVLDKFKFACALKI